MPDTIRGLEPRPLWIITCYHNSGMEVLTIDPGGDDGGSLPVFSFQEEAQEFLGLSENDQEEEERRWRIRETTPGALGGARDARAGTRGSRSSGRGNRGNLGVDPQADGGRLR